MDSLLRDINREQQKMQTDVENLQRHYEKLANFVHQYIQQTTTEWEKLAISHPQTLLLIIETTRILDKDGESYGGESEPIRFTAYQPTTETIVLDQLIQPTHSHDVRGTEYHGLTMSSLRDEPRLADAWPNIVEVLENHHIIIFGADYARQALQSVLHTHILDNAFCLHNRSKEYYGEFYDLSLEKVLGYQAINKTRDELKDSRERILCLAEVMRNLAEGMTKHVQQPDSATELFMEDDSLGDLDDHPF